MRRTEQELRSWSPCAAPSRSCGREVHAPHRAGAAVV